MSTRNARVVLELHQVQASPGVASVCSTALFPAEKEIREQRVPSDLIATTDWGGPLVDRDSEVQRIALKIVDAALDLTNSIDINKSESYRTNISWGRGTFVLQKLFGTINLAEISTSFNKISSKAQEIFKTQDALVRVSAPCKIFGDIHGQVRAHV
jgi:hypothetical protein